MDEIICISTSGLCYSKTVYIQCVHQVVGITSKVLRIIYPASLTKR